MTDIQQELYLHIDLADTTFGPGVFRCPRCYLRDLNDPSLNKLLNNDSINYTVESSGDAIRGIISPLGTFFAYAVQVGTGTLYAQFGSDINGKVDIDVVSDYDWLPDVEDDEILDNLTTRREYQFAKYSGFNKGIHRPFPSLESSVRDDVLLDLEIHAPSVITMVTREGICSQEFDIADFEEEVTGGYGQLYGGDFG